MTGEQRTVDLPGWYAPAAREAGVPSTTTPEGRVQVGPTDAAGFLRFWDTARRLEIARPIERLEKPRRKVQINKRG